MSSSQILRNILFVNISNWLRQCPLYTPPVAPTDECEGKVECFSNTVMFFRYFTFTYQTLLEEGEVVTRFP